MNATLHARRLCIAPMMGLTDRHFRFMVRLLTRHTLLYTEMLVAHQLLRLESEGLLEARLAVRDGEAPLAIQLGGDDPSTLARATALATSLGYDEINLNVGCPSPRVQKARFGACLMQDLDSLCRIVEAMQTATTRPVTVKHRLGVDQLDSYEALCDFIRAVAATGIRVFVVHARKALLGGVSARANRRKPPLRHEWVFRLKNDFPGLTFVLNGGILTLDHVTDLLNHVDGVMVGRAAYRNPWWLAQADARVFGVKSPEITPTILVHKLQQHTETEIRGGTPPGFLRHFMGLFRGEPGSRLWRQGLATWVKTPTTHVDLPRLYQQTILNSQACHETPMEEKDVKWDTNPPSEACDAPESPPRP